MLSGEEVEETELAGFDSDQQTFYCGNVAHNQILQITALSCRLVNQDSRKMVSEWRSPSGKNISVANCNGRQIICATGKDIFYLDIHASDLQQIRYFS